MNAPVFHYHVNLNERGSYRADVRDGFGNTVYEILAGNELAEDESSIFEDGFMRNDHDMEGLSEYLTDLGIVPAGSVIVYEG